MANWPKQLVCIKIITCNKMRKTASNLDPGENKHVIHPTFGVIPQYVRLIASLTEVG